MSNLVHITPVQPGKFIVFEGPDGCGKSTQLDRARHYITSNTQGGQPPLALRSPGGSPLAEVVREQLLSRETLHNDVRLHGMLLSMLSTTLEVVQPAIRAGRWVFMDRYLLSSVIYQGLIEGNSIYEVKAAVDAVFKNVDVKPDAYFVYNVSAETSLSRIDARGEAKTVFEKEALVRRMNPAYQFAKSLVDEKVFYIDGEGLVEDVWTRTQTRLESLIML